jgi:uncharacterized metal-binding protein YceD (DUF177 family)
MRAQVDDQFKIFVQHLREGKTEQINFEAEPQFLEVNEPELRFCKPVSVKGVAYVAGDELILRLSAETEAEIPCSVCNAPVIVPISRKGFYHGVPLDEIKNSVFDYREAVRENLIIDAPRFIECNGGVCPEREVLKKYFKEPGLEEEEERQSPFKDL